TSANVAVESHRSVTMTVAVIGIISWFAGESSVWDRLTVIAGAVVSPTRTAELHDLVLALASSAVNMTVVLPNGRVPGALFDNAGAASQTSDARATLKKGASCGSPAPMPAGDVHSTVTGAGQMMSGCVLSTTRTDA